MDLLPRSSDYRLYKPATGGSKGTFWFHSNMVGKILKTHSISKHSLSTYDISRWLCPWWIHIASPFWRKEYFVTLATSPPTEKVKPMPLVYSHTVATWALCYSFKVLPSVWHRNIIHTSKIYMQSLWLREQLPTFCRWGGGRVPYFWCFRWQTSKDNQKNIRRKPFQCKTTRYQQSRKTPFLVAAPE